MIEEFIQVGQLAREVTVNALLIGMIWALVRGHVVTRFHYDEVKADLEERIAVLQEVIRRLKNGNTP